MELTKEQIAEAEAYGRAEHEYWLNQLVIENAPWSRDFFINHVEDTLIRGITVYYQYVLAKKNGKIKRSLRKKAS